MIFESFPCYVSSCNRVFGVFPQNTLLQMEIINLGQKIGTSCGGDFLKSSGDNLYKWLDFPQCHRRQRLGRDGKQRVPGGFLHFPFLVGGVVFEVSAMALKSDVLSVVSSLSSQIIIPPAFFDKARVVLLFMVGIEL